MLILPPQKQTTSAHSRRDRGGHSAHRSTPADFDPHQGDPPMPAHTSIHTHVTRPCPPTPYRSLASSPVWSPMSTPAHPRLHLPSC
eukprot:43191-Chlamydomonas_euryale.AAC.1